MTQPKNETNPKNNLNSAIDHNEVLEVSPSDTDELSEQDLEAIAGGLGDPGNP